MQGKSARGVKRMRNVKLVRLIAAALFAAMTCVATMLLHIPSPLPNSYIHPGDSMVLLCGFLLGPVYGTAAAAIGSMLADVFLGFISYAPGTLVIKALTALVAATMYSHIPSETPITGRRILAMAIAGLASEAVMVSGYFVYEALFLGAGMGAVASLPGNLIQAAFGIVAAVYLAPFLEHIPFIRKRLLDFKG
jgi:uncharacterized membrane protein